MTRHGVVKFAQSLATLLALAVLVLGAVWLIGSSAATERDRRTVPLEGDTSQYEQQVDDAYQDHLIEEARQRELQRQQDLEDAHDEGYEQGYDEGFSDTDFGDYSPDGP